VVNLTNNSSSNNNNNSSSNNNNNNVIQFALVIVYIATGKNALSQILYKTAKWKEQMGECLPSPTIETCCVFKML